jgi:hypothetical protein
LLFVPCHQYSQVVSSKHRYAHENSSFIRYQTHSNYEYPLIMTDEDQLAAIRSEVSALHSDIRDLKRSATHTISNTPLHNHLIKFFHGNEHPQVTISSKWELVGTSEHMLSYEQVEVLVLTLMHRNDRHRSLASP